MTTAVERDECLRETLRDLREGAALPRLSGYLNQHAGDLLCRCKP